MVTSISKFCRRRSSYTFLRCRYRSIPTTLVRMLQEYHQHLHGPHSPSLANPELPFVPGIQEYCNFHQNRSSLCVICCVGWEIGLNEHTVEVKHCMCGRQNTTSVNKSHDTEWPNGYYIDAIRHSSGNPYPLRYPRVRSVKFECEYRL